MATEEPFKKVEQILESFGRKLAIDTRKSIIANEHSNPSGQSALIGSLRYQIIKTSRGYVFNFYLADYWEYIDSGTKGAKKKTGAEKTMTKSLERWITLRPKLSAAANDIKNKKNISFDKAKKSLAFLIRRSILKKGIRYRGGNRLGGSGFFTKDVLGDGRIEKISSQLSKELGREIAIELAFENRKIKPVITGTI